MEENGRPILREVYYMTTDGELVDFYDEEEIIENCTVQILRNSVTGKQSIGWWRND